MLKDLCFHDLVRLTLGFIHNWEQAVIDKNSLVYNLAGNFTPKMLNVVIFNQQFCYNTITWSAAQLQNGVFSSARSAQENLFFEMSTFGC